MPGKHRNRNIAVFAPWDGVRRRVRYYVSERKAYELLGSRRAIRVESDNQSNGKRDLLGIELVARTTDAVAIETCALAKRLSAEDTLGFTHSYVRSRSPFRWRGHR